MGIHGNRGHLHQHKSIEGLQGIKYTLENVGTLASLLLVLS
jgi:hypothetical protein